jgi:hypothetical protein
MDDYNCIDTSFITLDDSITMYIYLFLQFLMILFVIYQYIDTNIITVRPLEPQFQVGGGVGPWDSLRRADFLFMAGLAAAWGQPYFGHRFTWIMTINLPWNHYHQDQYIYIYAHIIYIYTLKIHIGPHFRLRFHHVNTAQRRQLDLWV